LWLNECNKGDTFLEVDTIREGVELDFKQTKESWDSKYKSTAEGIFENLEEETEYIESLTGKDIGDLPDNSDDSILLYELYLVANQNQEIIQQFAERKAVPIAEGEEFLFILKQLDEGNKDVVFRIFMYSLWLENRHRRNYAVKDGHIPNNYEEEILAADRSLKQTLSQNTSSENYKIDERRVIDFVQSTIFCIDRKTSDKEKRDVTGIQRRRNLGTVFVEVRKTDGEVNFRVGNKKIRRVLQRKFEEYLEIELEPADIVKEGVEPEKFEEALTTPSEQDDWKILNIDIKQITEEPSVALNIAKKSAGKDLRPLLNTLEGELVDLNILNINRFWFQWNEVEARVNISEPESESLILDSDIKTKSERTEETVREEFDEKFGIPLDQELLEHEITGEIQRLIQYILNDPPSYRISRLEQGLIKELEDRDIVKVEEFEVEEPEEDDIYPGGVKSVEKKQAAIRDYVKEIADDAGIEFQEMASEKVKRTKFTFARFEKDGELIDFSLPEYNKFTNSSYEYLHKTLQPVLIVNIGSIHDKLIENTLSSRLRLPELIRRDIQDENPEEYLETKVEELLNDKEGRISREALEGYRDIQEILDNPDSGQGTNFEQAIFPIFKQIIPSAQQWGVKRTGNQPDGFGELVFRHNRGYAYRSVAYDSKYTTDELHFDTDDQRQARDYCHKILGSKEVQNNKTKFRNFIIITNREENGNFGNSIGGKLNRMTKWDGVAVLMHIDFLLALYIVYNKNLEFIKSYRQTFSKLLYQRINGNRFQKYQDRDEDFFIELDGSDAEEIVEDLEEEIDDGRLDKTELREFLESDVFPSMSTD
jgi:hypothetical protein